MQPGSEAMSNNNRVPRLLVAMVLLLSTSGVWAQWELDGSRSRLNFISIKSISVAEIHSFTELVGYIGSDGKVQLAIDLNSVETLVPVRNERMRELLFDTASFPTANISAMVDPALIAAAGQRGTVTTELGVTLSLHGIEQNLAIPLVVIGEGDGLLQVFTSEPVLLNVADFGLADGIVALQELAGLQSISTTTLVTLHLVFRAAE